MEELRPSFVFHNQQKLHLKSETYRNLARLMSLCYENPQLLQPLASLPHDLLSANGACFDGKVLEKEMPEANISVCNETETISVDGGELGDAQMVFDGMEDVMNIEDDGELLKKDGSMFDFDDNTNSLKEVEMSQLQQLLFDELEHAINNKEEDVSKNLNQQTSEAFGSPLDNSRTCEILKFSDLGEDKMCSINTVQSDCQSYQKKMETENLLRSSRPSGSSNDAVEDGEIQEVGVTCRFEADGRLVDMLGKEKEIKDNWVFDNVINKTKLSSLETTEGNFTASGNTKIEMVNQRKVIVYEDPILAAEGSFNGKKRKLDNETEEKKHHKRPTARKVNNGSIHQNKANAAEDGVGCPIASNKFLFQEDTLHKNETENQGITSKEQDAGTSIKKKRGPSSKEKKKQKKRKKRAEKNRELGVKRLKLRPIVKPKPVAYCRHYLMGRCQEGEKCKFSHDTVPLTKSKPCCHFARHSCMKGDDCPFDHDLSKYPCNNYVSTGFCSRGENCMFSHRVPLKDDIPSTSVVGSPDNRASSLPGTSNSLRQLDVNQFGKSMPISGGVVSSKNSEGNAKKTTVGSPAVVPKGISFLSIGKSSSMLEANHSKLGNPSLKTNTTVNSISQASQHASATSQTVNEIPISTPEIVRPKGINFLAYGKAFQGSASSATSSVSLPSNHHIGVKSPTLNNFSLHKPGSKSPNLDSIQASKEASKTNLQSRCDEIIQKVELAMPQIVNPFSLGEARTDVSETSAQRGLSSIMQASGGKSVLVSKVPLVSDKHQNQDATLQEQPATPQGSRQLLGQLGHLHLKSTPNSAQKALMSTLAFAAKFECRTSRPANGIVAGRGGAKNKTQSNCMSRGSAEA